MLNPTLLLYPDRGALSTSFRTKFPRQKANFNTAGGLTARRSSSPVSILTMPHPDDLNADAMLMDFVEDTVVANAEPINVLGTSDLSDTRGEWVVGE